MKTWPAMGGRTPCHWIPSRCRRSWTLGCSEITPMEPRSAKGDATSQSTARPSRERPEAIGDATWTPKCKNASNKRKQKRKRGEL